MSNLKLKVYIKCFLKSKNLGRLGPNLVIKTQSISLSFSLVLPSFSLSFSFYYSFLAIFSFYLFLSLFLFHSFFSLHSRFISVYLFSLTIFLCICFSFSPLLSLSLSLFHSLSVFSLSLFISKISNFQAEYVYIIITVKHLYQSSKVLNKIF